MRVSSLLLSILFVPLMLFGGYSHVDGKWSPESFVPTVSVQEHYDFGNQAFQRQECEAALVHFMVIIYHFADSPFYQDALFYSALCYNSMGECDLANRQLDTYLSLPGKLKHFEKCFDYKLEIADKFSEGKKKHLFGMAKLPKWTGAKKDAISIYDEIIAALPGKEIAAQALYNKAQLLKKKREYRESIDSLQAVVRRFPKHTLAAESYLRISEIYLDQSRVESQNPDLIALAQVNIQRFGKSFPSDDRIKEAKNNLCDMHEVYAQSLYDTGRFYERKKKPHASAIYYQDALLKYPHTKAARKSGERLARISPKLPEKIVAL